MRVMLQRTAAGTHARRRPWLAILALALALAPAVEAGAAIAEAKPRAILEVGGRKQRPVIGDSRWTSEGQQGCGSVFVSVRRGWGDAIQLPAGTHASVYKITSDPASGKPTRVKLRVWERIKGPGKGKGEPIGAGRAVPTTLRADRRGGALRGWLVRFRLSVDGDRYLRLSTKWPDECGSRYMTWRSHVEIA